MEQAENTVKHLRKVGERITQAIATTQAQRDEAQSRLQDLTTQELPRAMADQALGRITQKEADETLEALLDLGRVVKKAGFALVGLKKEEAENARALQKAQKASHKDDARQRYDDVKSLLLEKGWSSDLEQDFRQCAASLGLAEQSEAEELLLEVGKRWHNAAQGLR